MTKINKLEVKPGQVWKLKSDKLPFPDTITIKGFEVLLAYNLASTTDEPKSSAFTFVVCDGKDSKRFRVEHLLDWFYLIKESTK